MAIVAVVVVAGGWVVAASLKRKDTGPRLTHTVKSGDLIITIREEGLLESSENTEIKCKIRGRNTVIWVIENGAVVKPGDELVRIDSKVIQDAFDERSKYAHWSRSSAHRFKALTRAAELGVSEYLDGRYQVDLMDKEKQLRINQKDLETNRAMLAHATEMAKLGYRSDLEVEDWQQRVKQSQLQVDLTNTQIETLKKYTKEMETETLKGRLNTWKAKSDAADERAVMDETRRDIAKDELEKCVIRAERGGLVIHPAAARWRNAPEIEVGAMIHKDQVLLLMPDLDQMQVKVGIHESAVDRVGTGMIAKVRLPDRTIYGKVGSVASVTQPPSWWNGNQVEYETLIQLPEIDGLRPGMSAEVEVIVARHRDVLTIPVASIVETESGNFCWVKTATGVQRKAIRIGDTNDVFTIVTAGIKEGDEVVLNPLKYEDPQTKILKASDKAKLNGGKSADAKGGQKTKPAKPGKPQKAAGQPGANKTQSGKPAKDPTNPAKPKTGKPGATKPGKPGASKPNASKPVAGSAKVGQSNDTQTGKPSQGEKPVAPQPEG